MPERFYMTNLTETDRSSMERVVVGRGSAHKVRLDVDKSSSVIQWEFISSQYDIGFGVYHKREEENGKRNKVELVCLNVVTTKLHRCPFLMETLPLFMATRKSFISISYMYHVSFILE